MSRQVFQIYLGPNNVATEKAIEVLDRLNSLNSVTEIISAIEVYAGQNVFGMRLAQRILNAKTKIGKFEDLNQIATVPGIGPKRFTIILSAFGNHN